MGEKTGTVWGNESLSLMFQTIKTSALCGTQYFIIGKGNFMKGNRRECGNTQCWSYHLLPEVCEQFTLNTKPNIPSFADFSSFLSIFCFIRVNITVNKQRMFGCKKTANIILFHSLALPGDLTPRKLTYSTFNSALYMLIEQSLLIYNITFNDSCI